MNVLEQEILENLSQNLINECIGCQNNYPSQKDHSCLKANYYNWALENSIKTIKEKYSIESDLHFIFEKYQIEDLQF